MNTRPVIRKAEIVKLSKDHHFSLQFCWKIRQALKAEIDTSRILKYVEYFGKHFLLPYFKEEEAVLFALFDDVWIRKAIEQHEQIDDLLSELKRSDEFDLKYELERLSYLIDGHIRYKERELFPHIELNLSDKQLEAIGKQLNDKKKLLLQQNYEDPFWINWEKS